VIGKAIYGRLQAVSAVTALVSTRVYPDYAPQNATYPFVVYRLTNNLPSDTKEGPSVLDTAQVTVEAYAATYDAAINVAENVRTALDRYSGTIESIVIDSIRFSNSQSFDMNFDEHIYVIEQTYEVRQKR
jgi:phytoene dehydrogenase-like protein